MSPFEGIRSSSSNSVRTLIRAEGVLKREVFGATGVKSVKNVPLSATSFAGEIAAPILSMIGTRVTLWFARVTERFRDVNGSNLVFALDNETSSEELVGLGLLESTALFGPVTI